MEKNKDSHIAFRVGEKERKLLEIMADRENRDKSDMLRTLIREGAAHRGLFEVGFVQFISKYEVKNDKEI